jgi:uncharacterized membrane protein YjjP (DUF1212 family)
MSKFQFLLISAIASSVLFLLIGNRDNDSIVSGVIPIAIFLSLSSLANRFIPLAAWEKFATSANRLTGRRIFHVRKRTNTKARIQRLLPPSNSTRL